MLSILKSNYQNINDVEENKTLTVWENGNFSDNEIIRSNNLLEKYDLKVETFVTINEDFDFIFNIF